MYILKKAIWIILKFHTAVDLRMSFIKISQKRFICSIWCEALIMHVCVHEEGWLVVIIWSITPKIQYVFEIVGDERTGTKSRITENRDRGYLATHVWVDIMYSMYVILANAFGSICQVHFAHWVNSAVANLKETFPDFWSSLLSYY